MFQITLDIGSKVSDLFVYNTQEDSLGKLIGSAVGLILTLAVILTLIFLLIGGMNWISAEKPENVEKARQVITNAAIGLAITMSAWAIWLLVQKFFGLNLTS